MGSTLLCWENSPYLSIRTHQLFPEVLLQLLKVNDIHEKKAIYKKDQLAFASNNLISIWPEIALQKNPS